MVLKPEKCCVMGSYECCVPMPLGGRRQDIDICITDIVAALNAANIITAASCCGHKQMPGNILFEDGRSIVIYENLEESLHHYKTEENTQ